MYLLIIIITYAACNVIRGSGKVTKVVPYAGFSIIYALCLYGHNPDIGLGLLSILAALSFGVDWVCNSWGWGDFITTGRKSNTGDFPPARWCADRLFDEDKKTKKWQTTAMSFRFSLTHGLIGIPLFAWAIGNWWYLCAIPVFMLSGFAYSVCFMKETKESLPGAEFVNGLLMGTIRGSMIFLL